MRWTAALLVLTACGSSESPPAPAPTPDPAPIRAHMHVHRDQGIAARDAVMMGDLDSVTKPLAWIASHDEPEGLPDQPEAIAAMRSAAAMGEETTDASTAGRAVAQLALACGACHQAVEGGPTFEPPELPSMEHEAPAHMARHQWAADRMWDALVVPSDAAWEQAVAVLAEGTTEDEEFSEGTTIPAEAVKLREEVHRQAQREVPTAPLRADVYARLLAACAQCHWAMGAPPADAPTPR